MSQFPQGAARRAFVGTAEPGPSIVRFPRVAERLTFREAGDSPRQDVVARARLEYHNRRCPHCRRVTVQPIELDDALLDRHCVPIPGTATVVGFMCLACRHEWQAERLRVVGVND